MDTKRHHAEQLHGYTCGDASKRDAGWLWLPALAPMSIPDTVSQSLCPRGAKKQTVLTDCIPMPSKPFETIRNPCITALFGNLPRQEGMEDNGSKEVNWTEAKDLGIFQ